MPCARTGSLGNAAGPRVAVTEPGARAAQTNKQGGRVSTGHVWEFFFNKMNCHQWRIIYHS